MKKSVNIIILAIALLGLMTTGCDMFFFHIIGTDNTVPVVRYTDYRDFTGIIADMDVNVTVIQSATFDVEITANENLVEYLILQKEGNNLHIGLDSAFYSYSNVKINAVVYCPLLSQITASTGADVIVHFPTGIYNLDIDATTAATVTGDTTITNQLSVDASTDGAVTLNGTADYLSVEGSTAATTDFRNLAVNNAEVSLSTDAEAWVRVSGTLEVDISTASSLFYYGRPSIRIIDQSTGANLVAMD